MSSKKAALIRRATEKDLWMARGIEGECFEEGVREDAAIVEGRFRTFPEGFLVACDENGKIVGYSSSEKWLEMRPLQLNENPVRGHALNGVIYYINSLAVIPDAQGRGHGFKLLLGQIQNARKERCKKVVLVTFDSGEHERFFTRHGFRKIGTVPDFFKRKNGENTGIIYEYKL